jgi:hypothetical protein
VTHAVKLSTYLGNSFGFTDDLLFQVQLLESIGAIDEEQVLTPLGFHLAQLPVPPKVSSAHRGTQ